MTHTIDISKLNTAHYNPRDITEKNYTKLKINIQTYGILQPLIVNNHKDRKNIIIGGHQRFRIANELGYKEVPVRYLSLNLHQEKKLNLALNKNTGHWDKDILANEFEIEQLLDIGFTEFELGINDFTEPTFKTFTAKLSEEEHQKTKEVITRIKEANGYNDTQAFMHIIQYFWKGSSVRVNNNKHLYKND
jgi:hypothetical protein